MILHKRTVISEVSICNRFYNHRVKGFHRAGDTLFAIRILNRLCIPQKSFCKNLESSLEFTESKHKARLQNRCLLRSPSFPVAILDLPYWFSISPKNQKTVQIRPQIITNNKETLKWYKKCKRSDDNFFAE